GTGLGLSITHGIITEHGGAIGISCPDSGGTLVTIELPVVDKEVWADVRKAVDNAESKTPAKGERVLIADDEKNIRDALSDILVKKGFIVNIARDGQEAIGLLERMRFSLLITDIRMPGISGMELYDAVLKKHAYLKDRVIMLTGDVTSQDVKDFLDATRCLYLLKPFEPKDLLSLINRVLS
ncbi:MAG: response regulator, partial [Deltaproteobacteria bacterium]|nr:response regulator [Deltaproteobacteria bacterium]